MIRQGIFDRYILYMKNIAADPRVFVPPCDAHKSEVAIAQGDDIAASPRGHP